MASPREPSSSRVLVLVLALGLPAPAAAQWTTLASAPVARQEVAVAADAGQVYVLGGLIGLTISNQVDVYDPATDSWSTVAPLPVPLHHANAAFVDDTLYVAGGWLDFFANATSAVWAYDPVANQWSPRSPMPTARAAMAVAVVDGKIYAAGGEPPARESDFAVYDPATNTWMSLSDMPTGRTHLAGGSLGGRFYAVGGRSGGIAGIVDAFEEYDPATGLWTQRTPIPTARGGLAAATLGGYLVVFGGEGNPAVPSGTFEEVEAYEPAMNAWTVLTPMPTPRHGIGAASVGERIYVPAGAPVEGFGSTDVNEAFDPGVDLVFCSDAVDNDGDGVSDSLDPGCASAADVSERDPGLSCDDGVDNDGDGGIDFRPDGTGDVGCRNPTALREDPACQDGLNNDRQRGTDFDAGVSVLGAAGADPNGADPQCSQPWSTESSPSLCGLGPELAALLPALVWMRRFGSSCGRRRGR